MRKLLLIGLLLLALYSNGQNKQLLYNFTAIPQSLMSNPGADVSYKYYFGVPFLSGISANIGSSGFSAYDLFANDGVDFNTKLQNIVVSTSRNDKVALNEQIELFSGGFQIGTDENKGYLSFGMYQEFDFWSYLPQDPAILALYGNKDYIGKVFNLGDLSLKAELLSVVHVGFHKNIKENLIVGARAKLYSSSFNATSTNNSGYIYTIPSSTTMYQQVIYSDLQLNTSGISQYIDEGYQGDVVSDMRKKALFGGDLGLGFDLGFTYYPKKQTQITASLIDVGFIKHSKDVETFRYKGTYQYEGVNPKFDSNSTPQNVFKEFQDAIPFDTIYTKYTTTRPVKFNASYQYSFDDSRGGGDCNCSGEEAEYRNAVGAQLFMMSTPRAPIAALTGFYRRNILKNLQMKATYTLDTFSYTNIGLGLSGNIGKFNVYLLADNLLEYRDLAKANSLSFQFGFNFIFKENAD